MVNIFFRNIFTRVKYWYSYIFLIYLSDCYLNNILIAAVIDSIRYVISYNFLNLILISPYI